MFAESSQLGCNSQFWPLRPVGPGCGHWQPDSHSLELSHDHRDAAQRPRAATPRPAGLRPDHQAPPPAAAMWPVRQPERRRGGPPAGRDSDTVTVADAAAALALTRPERTGVAAARRPGPLSQPEHSDCNNTAASDRASD